MKNIAVIPARSGSKRLKNKNIKKLLDLELFLWTIRAANASKDIDRIIFSTDSKKYVGISIKDNLLRNYSCEIDFRNEKEAGDKIKIYDWSEFSISLNEITTIVNTTSLGNLGSEHFNLSLKGVKKGGIAIDLIYNPLKTSFMKQAEKENMRAINGLDMLIYQAKSGFQNWFKNKPTYTNELRKIINLKYQNGKIQ